MLVITDGSDTHSTVKRQDVAIAARASGVIVYALVVDNEEGFGPGGKSNFNVRQSALELAQVTDATGGPSNYVQGFAQMEDAIEQMGKEFTQQYEVACQRGPADGRFHEITVTVKRPDVTVRHRRAYLAK
jgi:VWFA-related protein